MHATMQGLQREIKEIKVALQNSGFPEGRRKAVEQGGKEVEKVAIEGIEKRPVVQAIALPDI